MVKRTHMLMLGMVGFILLLWVAWCDAQETRKVYFGLMHAHTSFSDGEGTPDEAYTMAKEAGLDFFHDLAGYLCCDNGLCWHQHLQDMLAAVPLGQELLDELEQILQGVPSDRAHLLSDGDLTLCECKPFRFRS